MGEPLATRTCVPFGRGTGAGIGEPLATNTWVPFGRGTGAGIGDPLATNTCARGTGAGIGDPLATKTCGLPSSGTGAGIGEPLAEREGCTRRLLTEWLTEPNTESTIRPESKEIEKKKRTCLFIKDPPGSRMKTNNFLGLLLI